LRQSGTEWTSPNTPCSIVEGSSGCKGRHHGGKSVVFRALGGIMQMWKNKWRKVKTCDEEDEGNCQARRVLLLFLARSVFSEHKDVFSGQI